MILLIHDPYHWNILAGNSIIPSASIQTTSHTADRWSFQNTTPIMSLHSLKIFDGFSSNVRSKLSVWHSSPLTICSQPISGSWNSFIPNKHNDFPFLGESVLQFSLKVFNPQKD